MNRFLLVLAALSLHAQTLDQFLAKLDQAAASFATAKADFHRSTFTVAIKETDLDSGSMIMRKAAPGRMEFRIDITGDNAYSLVVKGDTAERYHPQINQIEVADLKKYRDTLQMLLALGFGMSGASLKANYNISNLRRETADGTPATAIDLAPKSADLIEKLHLQKVELWIADGNLTPVREKVYFRDAVWTIDYFNVQLNARIPSNAFDLPKNAKRVKY